MTAAQLKEKRISLDDFIPHLWTISQAPDPGCYEEFYEGLKVFDKDGGGKVIFFNLFSLERVAQGSRFARFG